ncbi:MAG: carboxy terminal-processing peptidase [Bacteroidetes bacterium]|nr:carboxy terminal-processing peptidase [Bacteroidota bacterium]
MMSKKFIPVILVLTGASLFVAFKTQGKIGNDDNPKSKYTKVLRIVGNYLEEGHYSPKKIDDAFSLTVFNKFTADLDDEKSIFLKSDIDSLAKIYSNRIDDEIHGSELQSFFGINEVYIKRRDESFKLIDDLLKKPFEFNTDEAVQLDREKLDYPKNEAERRDLWRKSVKYNVLSKFADLQDDREKSKGNKDFVYKADSTLEREAREFVRKKMERTIANKKTHETAEEDFSTFVNAITLSMDPHTDYFPPVAKRQFDEEISGRFYGIGAQLKDDDGKIKIATLIPGMPAILSGNIAVDDEIIKIGEGKNEPVDIAGYAVTDAVKLIRGAQKGSEVRLTIKKADGTIKVVSLLRDEVRLEDTYAKSAVINGEHKVGYIYLPEFYQDFQNPNGPRCSNDVAKEIEKLKAENVEGIIIDLRGNGGGSLSEVVKMAGLFIEDGPIVQVKGRDEKATVLRDRDKNVLYTGPLTVMVDEFSASASEIFAAAIQDYKRGIIIGSSSTYGKGTVQRNIPLVPESDNPLLANKNTEDLGALKLTLQKFYRINGGATQLKGVTPDIVLPDRLEYLKLREKDNAAALPWDEISKADYQTWQGSVGNDAVISQTYDQINKGSVFSKIKANIDWLGVNTSKPFSLNITKYRQEEKQIKDAYKQLDELSKLSKDMNVKNTNADAEAINAEKDKTEKNKAWLKRIGGDIYIDETVKVINNMIMQKATAKNN